MYHVCLTSSPVCLLWINHVVVSCSYHSTRYPHSMADKNSYSGASLLTGSRKIRGRVAVSHKIVPRIVHGHCKLPHMSGCLLGYILAGAMRFENAFSSLLSVFRYVAQLLDNLTYQQMPMTPRGRCSQATS